MKKEFIEVIDKLFSENEIDEEIECEIELNKYTISKEEMIEKLLEKTSSTFTRLYDSFLGRISLFI